MILTIESLLDAYTLSTRILDFNDGLDFHNHIERKGVRAHSRAGVNALVAKHFANIVGRPTIDDRWLLR